MTVTEFSTKLNVVVQYNLGVANIDTSKIEILFNKLRSNISKDVLIRNNPPISYSKALSRALRLKVIRQKIVKEKGEQPRSIAPVLRYD